MLLRISYLETGFAKAGNPDLYPAFMEQFPAATIDSVKIPPGEVLTWMLFKSKTKNGRVTVLKQVAWRGAAPFDAYSFHIDKDEKRYEFIVPAICGNVTLHYIAPIPPAPVAAPAPVAPAPVVAAAPPPAPAPAPAAAPVPAPEPPAPAPVPAPVAPVPIVAAAPPPDVAPVPAPVPVPPPPAAKPRGRLLADLGLSRQPDPANYLFARVGYEYPLTAKLYLMGLLGGYVRFAGDDGGSAFTADAMLDYHWMSRFSVGLGAGFWSGNDGQLDLLANVGFLVFGTPESANGSLFIETRLPADELGDSDMYGRFGMGLRYRF